MPGYGGRSGAWNGLGGLFVRAAAPSDLFFGSQGDTSGAFAAVRDLHNLLPVWDYGCAGGGAARPGLCDDADDCIAFRGMRVSDPVDIHRVSAGA